MEEEEGTHSSVSCMIFPSEKIFVQILDEAKIKLNKQMHC